MLDSHIVGSVTWVRFPRGQPVLAVGIELRLSYENPD